MSDYFLDEYSDETDIDSTSMLEELSCTIGNTSILEKPSCVVDDEFEYALKDVSAQSVHKKKEDDVVSEYSLPDMDVDVEVDGELKGIWDDLPVDLEADAISLHSARALDVDVEIDSKLKGIWNKSTYPHDDEVSLYSSRALDTDVELDANLKGIWSDL